MEILSQASMRQVKSMDKESMYGKQEKAMMVNGNKASNKVTEYGKAFMMTFMLVNGLITGQMGSENIHGVLAMNMRVNGKIACVMDRAAISFLLATSTLVSIYLEKQKGMVNTPGITDTLTPENFTTVSKVDKVNGTRVMMTIAINTVANTKMIKSMVTVNFNGAQVQSIKEIMYTTARKDTERCTGQMEVYTGAFGRMECNAGLVLLFSMMV